MSKEQQEVHHRLTLSTVSSDVKDKNQICQKKLVQKWAHEITALLAPVLFNFTAMIMNEICANDLQPHENLSCNDKLWSEVIHTKMR